MLDKIFSELDWKGRAYQNIDGRVFEYANLLSLRFLEVKTFTELTLVS